MNYTHKIDLYFNRPNTIQNLKMHQWDSGHIIEAHLWNAGGEAFEIPTGANIEFRAHKPDGTKVRILEGIKHNGNVVTVSVKANTLGAAGDVKSELIIEYGDVLGTAIFSINSFPSAVKECDGVSENDFGAITHYVAQASKSAQEAEISANKSEQSAEKAANVSLNPPQIIKSGGNWYTYNKSTGQLEDSGFPSRGEDGFGAGDMKEAVYDVDGTVKVAGGITAYGKQLAPPGSIKIYAGIAAPQGYLLCHGQAVSRSVYANLFAVCGAIYGSGNGSSTFNLPNLRGRFALGENNNLGSIGGSATHKNTVGEMVTHTHNFPFVNSGSPEQENVRYPFALGGSSKTYGLTGLVNDTSGNGQEYSTLPPYISLHYIIKT